MAEALLILDGMGVPLYSARGLTQALSPIDASSHGERSINGVMMDFSYSQFRKYQSVITCTDQRVPAIDNVWPGQVVLISCICELAYPIGGSPGRQVVFGSSREETDSGFIFYRPVLQMMLAPWALTYPEYARDIQWQLSFVEV